MGKVTSGLTGRPTKLNEKLAKQICDRIAKGESLRSVCRDPAMPDISTVRDWNLTNRQGFSSRYTKACEDRAHHWADELLDIADDGANDWMVKNDPDNPGYMTNGECIQRSRLRVDTRKWLLSKMLPKFRDKPEENKSDVDSLAQSVSKLIDKLPG